MPLEWLPLLAKGALKRLPLRAGEAGGLVTEADGVWAGASREGETGPIVVGWLLQRPV